MKYLQQKLDEFQSEQIEKFILRIPKHLADGTNVVNDANWNESEMHPNLDIDDLENHLIQEFSEYFRINPIDVKKLIQEETEPEINDPSELIDIANLAFLIWCMP